MSKKKLGEEIELCQFVLNMSTGLRHRIKMLSIMESEKRGEYTTMTQIITEVLEKHTKEVKLS